MFYVTTWLEVDPVAPNAARDASAWRCILVFFLLAAKYMGHRSDVTLQLVTNADHIPSLGRVDLYAVLNALGVDILIRDPAWRPHRAKQRPQADFYLFDVLEYCAASMSDDDHLILADKTCLVVNGPDAVFHRLECDGLLAMASHQQPDEVIGGLSRRQAAALYGGLGGLREPLIAPAFSADLIGLSASRITPFLAIAKQAFETNNFRARSGRLHLTDVAQLLSYSFYQTGTDRANTGADIRRIATGMKTNDTDPSDLALILWSLPMERDNGIRRLAQAAIRQIKHRRTRLLPVDIKGFERDELAAILGVGRRRSLLAYAVLAGVTFRRFLLRSGRAGV